MAESAGTEMNDEICGEMDPSEQQDNVVTMVDVLEEEAELEDSAFAVLGGSDDKNCTYHQGYVDRQALYSCKTCKTKDSESAGICLACSLDCHEGHELYELYTKRNFRCDCGNEKFSSPCKLCPKKGLNDGNKYNHNFVGLYCVCSRPYPDVETDIDDEMIQCIICEDWFHGRHLEATVPSDNEFAEMICGPCMQSLPFLWHYYDLSGKSGEVKQGEASGSTAICEAATDSGFESSCDSLLVETCKLEKLKAVSDVKTGATFWDQEWRSRLCKCSQCLALYKKHSCEFLLAEKDTVHYYENAGKEKCVKVSQYERGLKEITKMDRVKSIEAIRECNSMTSALKDYLKKFAESNKVVRQEDILEFFEGLKARKRQKIEIPYNCR